MPALLAIQDLSKAFGGVRALQSVSLSVGEGEIVGLIGPNGSGKTTLFDCLTGVHRADAGRTYLAGEDVTALAAYQVARRGLTRTFQLTHVFAELTLMDNLLFSLQEHQHEPLWRRVVGGWATRSLEDEGRRRGLELLSLVGLEQRAGERAGDLSYGQQKLLGFAMALAAKPRMVCLDEPAAAVAPALIETLAASIRLANRQGTSFLVIEHNMDFIMSLCDRVVVLAQGAVIADGPPDSVRGSPVVLEAYLGV